MDRLKKLYLIFLLSLTSQISLTHCRALNSVWNNFWSVSCQFKDVVSRSRRSVDQEPNFEDSEEFFNFLYPLADMTFEEFTKNEQRSSSGSPYSITTWLDDLVDLWQSECQTMNNNRDKRSTQEKDGVFRRLHTLIRPAIRRHDDDDASDSTSSPPEKASSACEMPKEEIRDDKRFFSQYGGDVEYFFPLMQFSIPFDGEIKLLGFQGFKGVYPY